MKSNPWYVMACVIGLALLWPCSHRRVAGGEQESRSHEFERADIPADQPAAWPKEVNRLEEIPRDKFLDLMRRLNQRSRGPRAAWLNSAHYEATLVNDTLRGGLMTASVQRFDGPPSLMELGPFAFALEDLKWQDRPAIWGSSVDGRVWVRTDGSSRELLGDWTFQGRSFSGGIDFDLQLPVATTSFMDLRIPREYSVYSPDSEVTLLSDVSTQATLLWRIHCGVDSRCRVTCVEKEGIAERRRGLLVDHDMHVNVREEDLRFQLILNLEALDAPVRDLILQVPAGLKINSALYGNETPVQFRRTSESEADGRVSIRLPGPLIGRGRTLRIDGTSVQKPGQPAISPQIVVEDSTFVGGRQVVTVQSPLQVKSIRTHGYRQLTPLTPNSEGESFSFQQLTSDAQLILDVHRPPVTLSGQVQSLMLADEDSWRLTTEIQWTSPAGGGFRTSCLFPPNWSVTGVLLNRDGQAGRPFSSPDDLQRTRDETKLNWEVQSQGGDPAGGDGKSLLTIEFMEAIQPGQVRAVTVVARRRPPEAGQPIAVPIPQLVNCDTSEVILGIQIPHSMTLDVTDDARLERIAPPMGALLAPPAEDSERRWYRGDANEATGAIKLSPRLPAIDIRVETAIETISTEYRVRYFIHYAPQEATADRLLVYLTEPDFDVRWTMKGTPSVELSAFRLKKSKHTEWNLPSKGELWEIRLPRAITSAVQIEGMASHRWSGSNRPALIYIPQAIDKLAQLKLLHPDSLEITVDAEGLKPTGQRLCWWYSKPDSEFGIELRNPEPSREFPLMVSISLNTLMSTDANGFDLYRARLKLENGTSHESLKIKLDPRAVLEDMIVDGESLSANSRDGEFIIPGLNATRGDVVELIYRVPASSHPLYERRHIVVPQVSSQVLGFFWEFAIPPSAQIFAEPSSIRLSRTLPTATWFQRIFGPLGRPRTEAMFYPLSLDAWKLLFQPERSRMPIVGAHEGVIVAPAEWQRHQAVSPVVPDEISVELWHAARIQLVTWISLGLAMSLGIGFRTFGWKYRDRVAAYVLGLLLAAATFAPSPYAECLGGAVTGTLVALLIPRRMLVPKQGIDDTIAGRPRPLPATLTACLIGGLTFCAITYLYDATASAQETQSDKRSVPKPPIVFVPVDKNGKPSESLPVVYVPREALSRWKESAGDGSVIPNYLISSARYELLETTEGHLNLKVKYRVHLIPTETEFVTVVLPLSNVSLPDADSCLVNGKSHPVGALPNGKGYSIELASPSVEPVERMSAETPAESGVTTLDIELRLRKPRPVATSLELTIPSIAKSQFTFVSKNPVSFIGIVGSRGASDRSQDDMTFESNLGPASHVQIVWGKSIPVPLPSRATVSLLQHVELRPSSREIRFHLNARIDDGELDALEFDLPSDAVLRTIHSRGVELLRSDIVVTKAGQRRLRLIFDRALRTSLVIDGTLLLLDTDSLTQTALPRFGLSPSKSVEWQYERNWWGISAPIDFRLETANLDPESVNTISSDAYLQAWTDAVDPRHPEITIPRQTTTTFELREGTTPTFQLIPNQPRRRAMQWKQIGSIGKRRLEWTLVGEIETTSSPTFQTVLTVDRRLRIEKISVLENGAERLTRWSEYRADPSRVVLFLSDKPQAKQTITLKASMAMRSGVPIALPYVRPEDCEISGGRLLLVRDPEVDVTTNPRDWKVDAESVGMITTDYESQVLVGQYQLTDPVPHGTIQTSSRHSRCSVRTAVLLRRTDGTEWKLTYRMEMTPEGESPMRMGLNFPAAFNETDGVTVEHSEPAWHEQNDRFRQLDLLLNRTDGTGTVAIQYETILTEPKQSEWELPLPTPLNPNSHETLLVIDPENVWFTLGGRDVRVADLPEWSNTVFNELPGGGQAFRILGPSVRIQRDVAAPSLREQSVRMLDQRIWLQNNGTCAGLTQTFLSTIRNELTIDLPPRVHVTALFLDDQPVALTTPSERRLHIPMTEAGTESVLTMAWVTDSHLSFEPMVTLRFPWPRDVRVDKSLITVLPQASTWIWSRAGLNRMNTLDQGLDRLETLLERHELLGQETRGAIANRWGIHQLQAHLLDPTAMVARHPTEESLKRLNRRNQMVESINQLEPVPDAVQGSWQARLLEEPVANIPGAIRGRGDDSGLVRFWLINRRWLHAIVAALLAIVLIPTFRRVIRIEFSEWLDRHVAVSWLLLATVWWLFLTPSALGSLLLLVALFRAVTQYNIPRPVA